VDNLLAMDQHEVPNGCMLNVGWQLQSCSQIAQIEERMYGCGLYRNGRFAWDVEIWYAKQTDKGRVFRVNTKATIIQS